MTDHEVVEIERALRELFRRKTAMGVHARVREAAGVDLDRPGLTLLHGLADEPLRASVLAQRLGLDLSTVSRKAQQLEHDGLLSRAGDPADRRAATLSLTADGRRVVDAARTAGREVIAGLVAEWSADERATFARLLGRFASALDTVTNAPPVGAGERDA